MTTATDAQRSTSSTENTGEADKERITAPSGRLEGLASWRVWIASAALFLPFAVVFFASSAPFSIPEVQAACGEVPLDMRFFTTGDGVMNFLDACGPNGRSAYQNLQIADLLYPAVVGLFLASSLALALSRISPRGAGAWLIVIPVLAGAFDYLENAFAWLALSAYPNPIITNHMLGFASAAKTTTSWVGGVVLMVSLGFLVARAGRRAVRSASALRTTAS